MFFEKEMPIRKDLCKIIVISASICTDLSCGGAARQYKLKMGWNIAKKCPLSLAEGLVVSRNMVIRDYSLPI